MLSVADRDERHAFKTSSVATMALVQSEFDFDVWARRPVRTLLENVRWKVVGMISATTRSANMAGIYYVGRPHEILED